MINKRIIIPFLILLVIPLAFAAKPTQVFMGGDVGLELRIPPAEFIKQNEDGQLNMHVFNASSGIIMDNITTNCIIYLFNSSGHHTMERNLDFDDEDKDFFINIDGNNFSNLGFISFILQCNTSNEGGFVSGSVRITETGEEVLNNLLPIILALIATIVLFSVVGYSTKTLGLKLATYSIALVEVVNLAFLLYLKESSLPLISMLKINFWIIFLISIGITFIVLIFLFMKALNLDDSMETDDKKWQGRK